jgi:hypothetical protein
VRRKLTRRAGVVVAGVVVLMALSACDTQPATDVNTSAATLNAKGKCDGGGYGGTNQYQLRDHSAGGGFYNVGPRFRFDCGAATAEVALPSHRVTGLKPGNWYQYRFVTRLDNGTVLTWDANGTNGGGYFDGFATEGIFAADEHAAEAYVSSPDGTATAASCRNKEINNRRLGRSSIFRTHLWTIELRTTWRYCGGQIVKMWPASAHCWVTTAGAASGYKCLDPGGVKVRAISNGGSPEHAVYTYSFRIEGRLPGTDYAFFSTRWCATNQISGSGAHVRHGSCEVQPW